MCTGEVSIIRHAVTLEHSRSAEPSLHDQVPAEETLAELRQRYLAINAHACSYIMKALRPAPDTDSRHGRPDRSSCCKHGDGEACDAVHQQLAEAPAGKSPCGHVISDLSVPAPSSSLHALGNGSPLPLEPHQHTCGTLPEAAGSMAHKTVPGGSSGNFVEAEVRELDLNATLEQCGLASPSAAKGDEPVLLLYWTDDLTPSC